MPHPDIISSCSGRRHLELIKNRLDAVFLTGSLEVRSNAEAVPGVGARARYLYPARARHPFKADLKHYFYFDFI